MPFLSFTPDMGWPNIYDQFDGDQNPYLYTVDVTGLTPVTGLGLEGYMSHSRRILVNLAPVGVSGTGIWELPATGVYGSILRGQGTVLVGYRTTETADPSYIRKLFHYST